MAWHLKTLLSEMLQTDAGSEFQADGPATENVHSPSLVKVDGIVKVRVLVWERTPCRIYPRQSRYRKKTLAHSSLILNLTNQAAALSMEPHF